ncbi:hypothetical protein [Microvirga sp. VF16]|uniref:hypothetical protein n=1 Tax=Microvirga sp. VF16 TaxID=2807101 RepID=UPI00193E349B|nr:hypothetical protein [Microvirga sp. VF16]QRM35982.1 hypothetical protein JO965_47280 [Microvirga sp. VF16]
MKWIDVTKEAGLHFLEWTTSLAQVLPRTLSSLPIPVLLGILAAPVVLAGLSRSGVGTIGAGILTLLTFVLLAQGEASGYGLPLLAYSGALLVAMNGFEAANRRRNLDAQNQEIERLRNETRTFLDALDRRAQIVDMMAANGAEMKVAGEGNSEGAEQVN